MSETLPEAPSHCGREMTSAAPLVEGGQCWLCMPCGFMYGDAPNIDLGRFSATGDIDDLPEGLTAYRFEPQVVQASTES